MSNNAFLIDNPNEDPLAKSIREHFAQVDKDSIILKKLDRIIALLERQAPHRFERFTLTERAVFEHVLRERKSGGKCNESF